MRIAVAGNGKLGASLLNPLLESQHDVVALVQNGRTTRGFRRWLYPNVMRVSPSSQGVLGTALRNGLRIVYIDKMTEEELQPLRELEINLLLVGGFGIILKEPLISLPTHGCLNTHSSLLPLHRGPNPFTAVIQSGEEKTGVTFHKIDPGIDTGPIHSQYELAIAQRDTAGSIYHRCCDLAHAHVVEVVNRIEEEGGINGTPQDPDAGCYDKRLKDDALYIDWNQSAAEIDRFIRACTPFNLARFNANGHVVFTNRSEFDPEPVDAAPGTVMSNGVNVRIATGEGTVTLIGSMAKKPVPWVWPNAFSRPAVGDVLE